mmetsp:Transcript_4861/g.7368  ORF Transcript_4861/g.7368 Transcript_4861/m.7368 type:complete len:259 (-) Transcript_4861:672-1448(-)
MHLGEFHSSFFPRNQSIFNERSSSIQTKVLSLLKLCPQSSISLETNTVNTNESLRISGVVIKRISTTLNIHGSQISIIKSLFTRSSHNSNISLVKLNPDNTLDIPLSKVNRVTNQIHLRRKPESIVAKPCKFRSKPLGNTLNFTIHADPLKIKMRLTQQSSSRCFINSTRFDSNKTVLNNVYTSNRMLSSNHVTVKKEFEGISDLSFITEVGDLGRNSVEEFNLDRLGLIRCSLGGRSHLEHGFFRTTVGILQTSTLV